MSTKDLGTYFLRVEFENGKGFIQTWNTSARYAQGTAENSPLDAARIEPIYETEDDVLHDMVDMYLEGNFSCDCNKFIFLHDAYQLEEPKSECGDTLTLKRLTAIRPDGTEKVIWEVGAE